jgi:hypothetical protein
MVLRSAEPLMEISEMRNLPGGKARPERKADNLNELFAYCLESFGTLDVPQYYGPPWPAFTAPSSALWHTDKAKSTK